MKSINSAIELFEKKEYEKALLELNECNPDDYSVQRYKGLCCIELKEYEKALPLLKKLYETVKTPQSEGELGVCYYLMKNYDEAQIHLIQSIVDEYNDYFAKTLEKALLSKHNNEAMLGLKLLMHEKNPKDIYVLRDITNYAQKLKKFDIAIEFFDILLKLCPNDYVAWNNLGLIYEELNKGKEAYGCYKKALALKDFFSPNFNLGIMSRKLHHFEDSIKYLKKAVRQNPSSPQPSYSLAMSYMMIKDFQKGYPLYAKHMSIIMPYFYKNEWSGKPAPDKTLCVFATGGLGDMIMFARYLDYLVGYFKKIYVLLPKSLHSIFKTNYPFVETVDSNIIFTDYDYAITPMHILQLFNLDFTVNVPKTNGYFKISEEKILNFKKKYFSHDKLKIAINWHGNREGTRTFFNRTMPVEKFEPLFEKYKDRAVFYSIQKDDSHKDIEKYPFVIDLYNDIEDFEDTGAVLKNCDLLISIDSSPVHMAGAVNVPCFVMVPYANEWRWFVDDTKSIWYDSVEIIRQNKEGDWNSVMEKVLDKTEKMF